MSVSRFSSSCSTGTCQSRGGLPVCPASIILLILLFWTLFSGGCSSLSPVSDRADRAEPSEAEPVTWPNAHLLVSAAELHDEMSNGSVRLVDMRSWGYDEGFIPGAVSIEGAAALTDLDHEIENFMIDARMFAELMGSKGIDRDTDLVLYDDGMALGAARLFYALERYGHRGTVRLLNGGFPAWQRAGHPVQEHEGLQPDPVVYETNENDGLVCDVAYISSRMGNDDFILFDARAPRSFAEST
jgi:thiosulfate/3-mercaptopyruvate sulfurtransferase